MKHNKTQLWACAYIFNRLWG